MLNDTEMSFLYVINIPFPLQERIKLKVNPLSKASAFLSTLFHPLLVQVPGRQSERFGGETCTQAGKKYSNKSLWMSLVFTLSAAVYCNPGNSHNCKSEVN